MAENTCSNTDHASDQHELLGQRDDDPGQTPVFSPELLSIKHLIVKEVLETINPHTIARYVGDMIGPQQNAIREALQPGMKRPHPTVDDPDSVSLYAESCGPLFREDGHNESTVPKEDSFVVASHHGATDNMSDLFPQKSVPRAATASKADKEQQLDIAEDILAQVDEEMPSIETFGDKILGNLAKRIVTQFQLEQSSVSKEMINRNKLPENCSDIAVPAINDMIKDIKNFESIRAAERRFYNIQTHVMRATAVIANIANMVLTADKEAKMVDSKTLIRSALDGVVFLGQAQSLLNNARKINVRTILTEDTKHICNLTKKPTKYLFGDDVSKSIKESKEMHRLSAGSSQENQTKRKPYYPATSTAVRPSYHNYGYGNKNESQQSFLDRGRRAIRGRRNFNARR